MSRRLSIRWTCSITPSTDLPGQFAVVASKHFVAPVLVGHFATRDLARAAAKAFRSQA